MENDYTLASDYNLSRVSLDLAGPAITASRNSAFYSRCRFTSLLRNYLLLTFQ